MIFRQGYAMAAKYAFYTGGEGLLPAQYPLPDPPVAVPDDDTRFTGREVLVECTPDMTDSTRDVRTITTGQRPDVHLVS